MIDNINVRVYACVVKDKKVLTLFEEYAGEPLMKFPGGGLEYGEGLTDCLKREFEEELNVNIEIVEHLYTQEDFLVSRFKENEQLLTIYYMVNIINEEDFIILDPCIEKIDWISIDSVENPFSLPIDRIVFDKLKEKFL
ncbi:MULTISPECIES: NUDIX hydrolase [Chryseobacterium]|uniref:NUDIX hydrolase n=1 Tax=Chryseobacterium TaxID=59732 RepID=UPI000FACFEF7|nr:MULTISPECIES: NUDIX hydrolase [Chryseobacterium]MBM7419913.1 ADP-ribose pyrophosphatase YjhB (NUDIX family) [Chryseobacterium sp. JUb44]MDH6209851.1 8-oxo-dGTP diphosphatase [Chryseobacterium sp. BIGb0186]WSO08590.1 NUDIX hydrolase [Chryseobacterium scophthalmum]